MIAFFGVTLVITYVTLVIGELAPKRLGLQRAERFALMVAPMLDLIARLTRGVIWLLSVSTNGLVRLLGGDPKASRESITDEELRGLVAAHESLGIDERRLIDEVFAARESSLREIMTPRTEVTFLDAVMTAARAVEETHDSPWSRYPVVRGSADDVAGFVHVRDLLLPGREAMQLGELVREVTMLPASLNVLAALSQLRREGQHLAIVVDEYGGTAGIVTMEDLIEEVVGEIRDEYDPDTHHALRLRGGDIVSDGLLNLDQFDEATGVRLPEGPYETAAGYVVACLGHLPALGESVECAGVRLTVTRLDGRRIDRLRVTRLAPPDQDADAPLPGPAEREPRSVSRSPVPRRNRCRHPACPVSRTSRRLASRRLGKRSLGKRLSATALGRIPVRDGSEQRGARPAGAGRQRRVGNIGNRAPC